MSKISNMSKIAGYCIIKYVKITDYSTIKYVNIIDNSTITFGWNNFTEFWSLMFTSVACTINVYDRRFYDRSIVILDKAC